MKPCRLSMLLATLSIALLSGAAMAADPGVAVLLVDTDHPAGTVDERIYGHFLEEINHSTVDGLFAEQIRGQGFEGKDFDDYWEKIAGPGTVDVAAVKFEQGEKSVRLTGGAGIRQKRIYLQSGKAYDGSVWTNPEQGTLQLALEFKDSTGKSLARLPLATTKPGWQEVPFFFTSPATDPQCTVELTATGTGGGGAALVDFLSLMPADARKTGKMRPDLLDSLKALKPPFIRWPGGSYASIYKWKDGVGPAVSRKYNPNTIWGDYSDYYGFGTDEFLELCRQLGSQPMIVLAATDTSPAQLEYAMDWLHYLLDPATTDAGKKRAANGHPAPYVIPYIQIDNEPMNHDLKPDQYAAIVNLYGPRIRQIAPQSKIVACGQKRSNDMNWSQKMIDTAGNNFDILGCHNYEYEPDNYATGVRRIEDYLDKVSAYIHTSKFPNIKLAVLEWGLCRSLDWRAGLHAAGSLISYEKLSPTLDMSCPALLMRNTSDNPEWRAWIYHDHVSWFAGGGYVAEKLFRDHFAPIRLATTNGTFKDIPNRADFFTNISQMKPEKWSSDTLDAIATTTPDNKRFILKAVNYAPIPNTLLTRLQGKNAPTKATVTITTISAAPTDENSLKEPNKIHPTETTQPYAKDMAFTLPPYTVAVVEIKAE